MGIILDDCAIADTSFDIASADAPSSQFVRVSKCDAVFPGADPFLNPVPVHGQILRNRSLAHKHAVKPMIRPSPAAWAKASATSSAPCRSTASSTKTNSKNRSTTGFKFFGIPNPPPAPMAHSSPAIRSEKPKRLEAKKGFRCSNRWWMICSIFQRKRGCRSRFDKSCFFRATANRQKFQQAPYR